MLWSKNSFELLLWSIGWNAEISIWSNAILNLQSGQLLAVLSVYRALSSSQIWYRNDYIGLFFLKGYSTLSKCLQHQFTHLNINNVNVWIGNPAFQFVHRELRGCLRSWQDRQLQLSIRWLQENSFARTPTRMLHALRLSKLMGQVLFRLFRLLPTQNKPSLYILGFTISITETKILGHSGDQFTKTNLQFTVTNKFKNSS